jgi:hypothetical protein
VSTIVAACVVSFTSAVYAGAPNSPQNLSMGGWTGGPGPTTVQDPQWVALKLAHRIRSGVLPGQAKGTAAHPYVTAASVVPLTPSSWELTLNNPVPTIWEPGSGCTGCSNFGSGTANYDDARHTYSASAFPKLCGPGAADVALYYWPAPPNLWNNPSVTDTWDGGTPTTWNGYDVDSVARTRGYMMKLAWQIKAPTWSASGMMNAQPKSSAVWLQVVRDALNWEASGENTSNWTNYIYVVVWYPGQGQTDFHNDVVGDIYTNNVPVVAEVNAQMMPNWTNNGGRTNHYITIIGYDDNAGIYYYTDTCGHSTGCGSKYDGGVRTASQTTVWNAITNIPYNQSTGDGGWIW